MNEAVEPVWKLLEKAGYVEEARKLKNRWIKVKVEKLVEDLKCGTR